MKLKALILGTSLVVFTFAGVAGAETPVEKPYPSREESLGLVGGAGIGALAGGPFGLVLGMAFGGWIGDRMDTQKKNARALNEELEDSRKETEALNAKLEDSDRAVEALSLQLKASRERLAQVNEKS